MPRLKLQNSLKKYHLLLLLREVANNLEQILSMCFVCRVDITSRFVLMITKSVLKSTHFTVDEARTRNQYFSFLSRVPVWQGSAKLRGFTLSQTVGIDRWWLQIFCAPQGWSSNHIAPSFVLRFHLENKPPPFVFKREPKTFLQDIQHGLNR